MRHKQESRRAMEKNEEAEVTNERTTIFYLYHPCSLLQKFLGTFFKCLGFEIETNKKEHELKNPSDHTEEDLGTENKRNVQQALLKGFQIMRTLIIRRGGPRRSDLSKGSSPGIN
ncbi:unnamed protein product [Vicia faba]|uniref:Uncharacterized protein n=1 Tax=Vicia faba TaxID=3906 RepID=A0AAV0Z8R1_VICFA|nr:unnamed protein product [Vicia faba]